MTNYYNLNEDVLNEYGMMPESQQNLNNINKSAEYNSNK
jgi:hypothetical protein